MLTYNYMAAMICHSNEAVAASHDLDIVNVYEHLYIPEGMFCNLGMNYLNDLEDLSKFCPDGVHPYNPTSLQTIADIWASELRDILATKKR